MKPKRYLVTGGTGFIGSALVRSLVQRGNFVRTLDNDWRGKVTSLTDIKEKIDPVIGDIRDSRVVNEAVQGVDAVCHLAAINGTQNFYDHPDLVLDVGVRGLINVLDACEKHHVGDLLLMSTSEVYQTPSVIPTPETAPLTIPSPHNPRYSYAASKIISEMMVLHCAKSTLKRVTIIRPHNVYGPAMGNEHVVPQMICRMKELKKSQPGQRVLSFPIQGSGKETRSFVYISDMIDATLRVLDSGRHKEIYHVGTVEEISVATLAREIARAMDCQIELIPGPVSEGGTPRRCPEIKKMQELGYNPRVSLKEGLSMTCDWYNKNA